MNTFTAHATSRRTPVLALLSLLQFLIAIDVTVVNVALPAIGARFDAEPAALSWVVTGYTLVGGGLLLLGGRLTDLLGRRRMFLLGAALFALASLAAGLAPNLPTLVAARFAQGAGEALASPAAMSLIALLYPCPEERAKALGIWGAISASGLVVGVLLSGALVQLLDWRWIFGVNVPLTSAVLVLTPVLVRPDGPRPARGGRLDLPGATLLTAGPLALVYGVLRGSPAALLAGAVLLVAFILVEARSRNPLVPLAFFAHRVRALANAVTVPLSAGLSGTFFLATLYLQEVIELSPLQAGLAYLPFCAALLLAVSQVARLIGALGVTYTALLGLLLTAAGLGWLARLPDHGGFGADVLPGMLGVAAGMGIGLVALQHAALSDVTEDDAGTASGVQRSVDQLGGSLGLAVLVGAALGGGTPQGADYRTAFGWAALGVLAAAVAVAAPGRGK